MTSSKKRVIVPEGYPKRFCFDLGQENADIVAKPLVRGSRFLPWLDSVTFETAKDADLLHTLNAVPLRTQKPHIITFESYLPRVPDDRYNKRLEQFLFKKLMRPECKRLIAFSEYALNQFKTQIARYHGFEALLDKTEVLCPAIDKRRQDPKYPASRKLKLLFVGRQFMHKGGPAVVRAHEQLRAAGIPVDTVVVSNLHWSGKGLVGPGSSTIADAEHTRLRQDGITHYTRVANEDVLRLIDDSHFVLLPTVNDTFGFSCLEALASATPVIASATCALPEIVQDGVNGFLLTVPNDENGRWEGLRERRGGGYDRLYLQLIDSLANQMVEKLEAFWSGQSMYPELSRNALKTVETKFGKQKARIRLEEIYANAA
jgi:glycosyltransferase involved in cell wall biosynthesis